MTEQKTSYRYTKEEAKKKIDLLLAEYGEDCVIEFRKKFAEIMNSCRVRSRSKRLEISGILAETEGFSRSAENISAEWQLHNLSYQLGVLKRASQDAALDYRFDPRLPVRICTAIFEALHIE